MAREIKLMYMFVDFVGILILLLLRFNFGSLKKWKKDHVEFSEKIFHYILFTTFLVLLSDMFSWWLNTNKDYIKVNYVFTSIFFIMQPIVSGLWIIYVDDKLRQDVEKTKKLIPLYLAPAVFLGLVSTMSFKYQVFFGISSDGTYFRGDYYIIFILVNMIYLVGSTIMVLIKMKKNKKSIDGQKHKVLLLYPIFPIMGTLIQTIIYGVDAAWILTTVSLIVIYFNLQNNQLITDPLTGLNNRFRFEQYLDTKLLERDPNKKIFLAMIDLDKFKSINDKFGHLEGDEALVRVSKLIIKGIQHNDFFARLGGDEFVIVGSRRDKSEVVDMINKINYHVDRYNESSSKQYKISLSIGYGFFDPNKIKAKAELLKEADAMMYMNKKRKPQAKIPKGLPQ